MTRREGSDIGANADQLADRIKSRRRPSKMPARTNTHASTNSHASEGAARPYSATAEGLVWHRPAQGANDTPLTNFTARITAEVVEDDGAEQRRLFLIEANLRGRLSSFEVGAGNFAGLGWVTEHLGAEAIVWPGSTLKDHTRVAIQLLSGEVPRKVTFTHTGWGVIGEEAVYLHAGGAIGPNGPIQHVETRLEGGLAHYVLPDPPVGDELRDAVRMSLDVLELAPGRVVTPLLAAVYRASLCPADFTVFLAGPTHAGKSELAALAQQHYGAAMTSRNLPGTWISTANSLEATAFQAKDALFVVDDFAPSGSTADVQRMHREADRLLRAQGNRSARQRMRSDTSLRPPKPPRGLILSTGEDIPQGQSLRGRLLVLELGPDDVDWTRLTGMQAKAAEGVLACAMSGFIRWLAGRYDGLENRVRSRARELRQSAVQSTAHRRTPEIVANLAVGLEHFLGFATEIGAIDADRRMALWERGWSELGEAGAAQAEHVRAAEPTGRFLALLRSAISSGEAHLAGPDGSPPERPNAWGWVPTSSGDFMASDKWNPQGSRIGWTDGDDVWLDPEASYKAAQRMAQGAEPLAIAARTLQKRLHERRLLASVDDTRGRYLIRKVLQGARHAVLHMYRVSVAEETAHSTHSAQDDALTPVPEFSGEV